MGLDQPGAGAPLLPRRRAALLVAQLDAVAAGEVLDRLDEAQQAVLADVADDVAGLAAAEAHVVADGRVDVERRRLLVVEGAQALEPAAAGAAQLHARLDDDVGQLGALADGDDVLVADPPCHRASALPPRPDRPWRPESRSRPVLRRRARCSATAAASVRLATASTTTRSRPASSAAASQAACPGGLERGPAGRQQRLDELADDPPLVLLRLLDAGAAHDVPGGDGLEQRALGLLALGHDEVRGVAGQRSPPCRSRVARSAARQKRPMVPLVSALSAAWSAVPPS